VITLNCIYVTLYFYNNTFNVSIVRIKIARSTIGYSEVPVQHDTSNNFVSAIMKIQLRYKFCHTIVLDKDSSSMVFVTKPWINCTSTVIFSLRTTTTP
jgi:hypothetical protein